MDKSTTGTSQCSIHSQNYPVTRYDMSEGHRCEAVKLKLAIKLTDVTDDPSRRIKRCLTDLA